MSLALAAKHLESQGRGGDSHLVHMSTDEVKALRGLAQAHGGDLTINPKTGLPEAGFLSSILPTVAGLAGAAFFGPEMLPLIAGGIGLADFAITGNLGQGIMAGLGAWTGGSLAGDIGKVGLEAGQQAGADMAQKSFEDALAQTGTKAADQYIPSMLNASTPQVATDIANSQIGSFNAAFNPAQQEAYANAIKYSGGDPATLSKIVSSAGSANAANTLDPLTNFTQGFSNITSSPSAAWDFAKANKMDVIGSAFPFVTGALQAMQPSPYVPPAVQKNPFNLKTIASNFQGTFPAQPSPPYQAQYRDYVANPYTSYAAKGGLQHVHKYAGATNSVTSIGNKLLGIKDPTPAPIGLTDPNAVYDPTYYEGTSGISANKYSKDYDNMSSDAVAKDILTKAKSLGKVASSVMASKSATSTQDPAQTSIASIQSEAPAQSVKEGGLLGYAGGGLGTLGGYSDGGRLLKGPGDGVSDSIPASIGHRQPARLAEGEFVIPARIVSELGNGSTDAGAKRLYAMMDRIKAKRAKTKDIAADSKAYNLLPA